MFILYLYIAFIQKDKRCSNDRLTIFCWWCVTLWIVKINKTKKHRILNRWLFDHQKIIWLQFVWEQQKKWQYKTGILSMQAIMEKFCRYFSNIYQIRVKTRFHLELQNNQNQKNIRSNMLLMMRNFWFVVHFIRWNGILWCYMRVTPFISLLHILIQK